MKRLFYGGVALTGIFIAGMLWEAHVTPPPPTYTETQLSPIVIGELVKHLKMEAASRTFEVNFDLEHDHEISIAGMHIANVPLEWGTYEATAIVSAGFAKGAVHILKMDPGLIEFQFDAPSILHVEKKVRVRDHGKVWSDMHFQEQADAQAERMLRTAACNSSIRTDANEGIKAELESIVHERYPNTRVVVHLTMPATC
jgi:hypothetical protein